ncbi:MAG: DUF1801 domain-containing protein [Bacteroidota bacterium]
MEKAKSAEAYFSEEHPFKNAIATLRDLAKKTEAVESCKWGMPVYTIENKNVFGICRFKNHFGVWFYNGAYMSDPKKVLQNAQEGKTKAMRHWKFSSEEAIDAKGVLSYLQEAITKQKEGKVRTSKKSSAPLEIPSLLRDSLEKDGALKTAFTGFTPYKQKEFCEYLLEAKQESTRNRRLEKILPMIARGIGLNDAYR